MNTPIKIFLLLILAVILNAGYANSNVSNKDQKLYKFEPSNLAIYVPKETTMDKTVYDYPNSESTIYNFDYYGVEVYLEVEYSLRPYREPEKENRSLENVNQMIVYSQTECKSTKKVCISVTFNRGGVVSKFYNTSILVKSSSEQVDIAEKFLNHLYIDDTDLPSADPDKLIAYGPFEINAGDFDMASSKVPNKYYDHIEYENFERFVQSINRQNVPLIIEGHTDQLESDAGLADRLSQDRADSFRKFLIAEYGMNYDISVRFLTRGFTRPVASNTDEERGANRRVRVYADQKKAAEMSKAKRTSTEVQ